MHAVRRVVLLGSMASGKSTVGALLARRLGWPHLDFDREIEREHGRPVAEIFAEGGEAAFRSAEAAITPRLLRTAPAVLTPGGGWVTNPGVLGMLPPDTMSVWLRVSAPEVVRRAVADGGPARPLLQDGDPLDRVERLLRDREPLYRRADLHLDTDGRTPDQVAADLEARVRDRMAGTPEATL